MVYDKEKPWTNDAVSRSQPGWPNEGRKITENWAAYVDTNNFGIGAYVPIAKSLTCYRYAAGRTSQQGACSYFAPITHFSITPGFSFEYDLFITLGAVDEIRKTFRAIHEARPKLESEPHP